MRVFPLIWILMFSFFPLAHGQEQRQDVLDSSRALVNQQQYQSAFDLLQQADPNNNNPFILLEKTSLLTRYYVVSMGHVFFALKDIPQGRSLEEFRDQPGQFRLTQFDADSLTRRLLGQYPDNYLLYRNLAGYWYERYMKYGDPEEGAESPLDTIIKYGRKALLHGDRDPRAYYVLAYSYLASGRHGDAIPHFHQAIKINDSMAVAHYNLAHAYLQTREWPNALVHANRALELYDDPAYKARAARMAGVSLAEMEEPEAAKHFFNTSLRYEPENYNTLKSTLNLALSVDNDEAQTIAARLFALNPESPRIANDLIHIYQKEEQWQQLLHFFNEQWTQYQHSPVALGNISFAKAKLLAREKPHEARKELEKAEKYFQQELPPEHDVFSIIKQAKTSLGE